MHTLIAMPYRVGFFIPEYCKTPELQKEWLNKNQPKARKVTTLGGVPLYFVRGEDKSIFFTPSDDGQAILYVMELYRLLVDKSSLTLPPVLFRKTNYQGSVWRQAALIPKSRTFAHDVFYKYLISDTRNVVSDSSQSHAGESFWYSRIAEALASSGFEVYGLDCEAKHGTLFIEKAQKITTPSQIPDYYTDGEDYSGQYKRIALVKV